MAPSRKLGGFQLEDLLRDRSVYLPEEEDDAEAVLAPEMQGEEPPHADEEKDAGEHGDQEVMGPNYFLTPDEAEARIEEILQRQRRRNVLSAMFQNQNMERNRQAMLEGEKADELLGSL